MGELHAQRVQKLGGALGNTHFRFTGLNNRQVAELIAGFLRDDKLD